MYNIYIYNNVYIKLNDKNENFSFHIVCMSNFHSNIPSFIFYETVMSELLRIAKSSSSVASVYEKGRETNENAK